MLHKNKSVLMQPCKTTADLLVVINYKQTMGDCLSKGKQVDETGLERIIQMNCSCLPREKGIFEKMGCIEWDG